MTILGPQPRERVLLLAAQFLEQVAVRVQGFLVLLFLPCWEDTGSLLAFLGPPWACRGSHSSWVRPSPSLVLRDSLRPFLPHNCRRARPCCPCCRRRAQASCSLGLGGGMGCKGSLLWFAASKEGERGRGSVETDVVWWAGLKRD